MVFELGKCYRHKGTGLKIRVVCEADTYYFGHCLIAERDDAKFYPVGSTEDYAVNWEECPDWAKEHLNKMPADIKERDPDTFG